MSRAQVRAARELIRLRGEDQVHPVVRKVAGLEFDQELFAALQRHRPAEAVLRREGRFGDVGVDFLLEDDQRVVAIESKSSRQSLGPDAIRRAGATLRRLRAAAARPVSLLVVSRAGFTKQAQEVAGADPAVRLVTWAGWQDDEQLKAALAANFAAYQS